MANNKWEELILWFFLIGTPEIAQIYFATTYIVIVHQVKSWKP